MRRCFEGATVEEAVEIVRTLAEAVSNIHNVFVVDHRFHLLGVLPLARLILARAGETVDAVMDRQVISVTVDTDQEEVAQLFRKYDLLSLPVTDPRGALLGRITVDDVVDVLEEEANEDFAKLSGLGQEEPIFDSPDAHDPAAAALAGAEPRDDQPQRQRHRPLSGHDRDDCDRRRVDDDCRRPGRQCRGSDAHRHGSRPCPGADHAWSTRAGFC